jgi:hypothetical protein
MHLGEISFCDKIGYNVKSDEFRKKVLNDLETAFGFKIIQKHFEKYTDGSVHVLKSNPHMISLRSNGNPYLLYLTRYHDVNQCIFIDKKIQHGYFYPRMIIVKFWFDDDLFSNTLFDGEMVKGDDGQWSFIIGDMIADSGSHLASTNLIRRINRIYEMLDKQFRPDELDVCNMCVKRYFQYHEHDFMINTFMQTLQYTCRGMYFKPLFLKFRDILVNFDDDLIKKVVRTKYKEIGSFLLNADVHDMLKQPQPQLQPPMKQADELKPAPIAQSHSHNVDGRWFSVQKTNQADLYELYDEKNNCSGVACVNSMITSKMMRELFRNATPTEKIKMVCTFSDRFQKWVPISTV